MLETENNGWGGKMCIVPLKLLRTSAGRNPVMNEREKKSVYVCVCKPSNGGVRVRWDSWVTGFSGWPADLGFRSGKDIGTDSLDKRPCPALLSGFCHSAFSPSLNLKPGMRLLQFSSGDRGSAPPKGTATDWVCFHTCAQTGTKEWKSQEGKIISLEAKKFRERKEKNREVGKSQGGENKSTQRHRLSWLRKMRITDKCFLICFLGQCTAITTIWHKSDFSSQVFVSWWRRWDYWEKKFSLEGEVGVDIRMKRKTWSLGSGRKAHSRHRLIPGGGILCSNTTQWDYKLLV